MANKKGTFSKDNQPKNRKGVSERTKILDALKRKGKTEEDFYDHLIEKAIDENDTFTLKEILARFSPLKKTVMPNVEFEFNKKGTPVEQVSQLLDAVSSSMLPPDVGSMLISAIRNAIDIEMNTEIKVRLEKLEKMFSNA